ncbi:unnamed protein product, partial [Prorocentrum cordatum]
VWSRVPAYSTAFCELLSEQWEECRILLQCTMGSWGRSRGQKYTVCSKCQNWVYDWRLRKQGGCCGKCGTQLQTQLEECPGRSGGRDVQRPDAMAAPDELLTKLCERFPANSQIILAMQAELAKPPEPPPKPAVVLAPADRYKQATEEQTKAKKAVEKQIEKVVAMQAKLSRMEEKLEELSAAHLSANMEVELAAETVAQTTKAPAEAAAPAPPQPMVFAIDSELLEYLEEADEEFRTGFTELQAATDQWHKQQDEAYKQIEADRLAREQARLAQEQAFAASQATVCDIHGAKVAALKEKGAALLRLARTRSFKKRRAGEGAAVDGAPAEERAPAAAAGAEKGKGEPRPGPGTAAPGGGAAGPSADRLAQHKRELAVAKDKAALAYAEKQGQNGATKGAASTPAAQRYMVEHATEYAVVGCAETHLSDAKHVEAVRSLARDGWKASGAPAWASVRSETGTRGGELVASRVDIAATTFSHLRGATSGGGDDPLLGFAPLVLHMKQGNLVVVMSYMFPGLGVRGANRCRFAALGAFLMGLADPWVVLADWNLSPNEMAETSFPGKVGGELLLPQGTEATCFKGSGSLIDFGLVSEGLSTQVELTAVLDVPWPTRAAGPDSKSSKRKAASLARRRDRLSGGLQEAFVDLQLAAEVEQLSRLEEEAAAAAAPALETLVDYDDEGPGEQFFGEGEMSGAGAVTLTRPEARQGQQDDGAAVIELASRHEAKSAEFEPVFFVSAEAWAATAPSEFEVGRCSSTAMGELESHRLVQQAGQGGVAVSRVYAEWVSKLEVVRLGANGCHDAAARRPYCGRASGYDFRSARLRAAPGRAHLKHQASEHWSVTLALLRQLALLRGSGKAEEQRQRCFTLLLREVDRIMLDCAEHFNRGVNAEVHEAWALMMRGAGVIPLSELEVMVGVTERFFSASQARSLAKSRRDFGAWARTVWKQSPGVLHRHVRDPGPETSELVVGGRAIAEPGQVRSRKAQRWGGLWRAPVDSWDDLMAALQ